MGISNSLYADIWCAMSCTVGRRQRVENLGDGWSHFSQRANAMITELEDELAAVNRLFLYVHGVTSFSLDDDHQRLRSRAVAQLTMMSHNNNPQKALGPVNNARCSALNPVFLFSHYSRPVEKNIDAWERLVRLMQGVPTAGPVRTMTDALFASDRGYNGKETVEYITNRIGATVTGTYKRSLDYLFFFGQGATRKRHKGVVVSESGCRAVYSAKRKTKTGRTVEAIVYRESVSGRIAAMYHNNDRIFSARQFTLIPKAGHEEVRKNVGRELFHLIFDRSLSKNGTESSTTGSFGTNSMARMKVMQALSEVVEITIMQSGDPGWFLGRAFQYTSLTTQAFLRSLANNHEDHLEALASLISGKRFDYRPVTFLQEKNGTKKSLMSKLLLLSHSWNIQPTFNQREHAASCLMSATATSLQAKTKNEILNLLSSVSYRQPNSLLKRQLVEKASELKASVENNTAQLSTPAVQDLSPSQRIETKKTELLEALYKASLTSWVMKPLVSTVQMEEGNVNESQVLKALPSFFEDHDVLEGTQFENHKVEYPMKKFIIEYIRTTGLVSSKRDPMMSDSPDGILCLADNEGEMHICGVEIKTMTSLNTIDAARQRRYNYAPLTYMKNVGQNEASIKQFHDLIPSGGHRTQFLHHSVCLNLNHIVFVQAKGGNGGVGEVIYVTIVHFHSSLRHNYSFILSAVRVGAFQWGGERIPPIYRKRMTVCCRPRTLLTFIPTHRIIV
ncbi:unnamed protein product [Agarophyton chilense]